MKYINWFMNYYAIPGLVIGSIASALVSVGLLVVIVFNLAPASSKGHHSFFGFSDYAKGIPVKVSVSKSIPDTSIYYKQAGGEGLYDSNAGNNPGVSADKSVFQNGAAYADTILTGYQLSGAGFDHNRGSFHVNGFSFTGATAYIKTDKISYRLLFASTSVFILFLISYCAWQIGMLLYYIQNNGVFEPINYKRLQNIGFAVIFFELFCLLIGLVMTLTGYDWSMQVLFTSTIPHFRSPLIIHAEPVYGFEWSWLIIGCIFVIVAKAFHKGYTLQTEQDLTI